MTEDQEHVEESQEEDQENLKAQEIVITITFWTAVFFILKATAQAIAGWLGLKLFKKILAWFKRRKNISQNLKSTKSNRRVSRKKSP